jgi:hypothetical protein
MQARCTTGGTHGANSPLSWQTAHTSDTPEFIAGTFAAQPPLTAVQEGWFEREGAPLKALRVPTPVRTGRVVVSGNGFEIEPYHCTSPEGELAYLLLVTDYSGQAEGIVAWSPQTGRLAASHHGVWALGQGTVHRPRLTEHQGLRVWRCPWGWLRAGREGVVPVRTSALPFQLDCAGSLIVEDTAYGKELEAMLQPARPRIRVAMERMTA